METYEELINRVDYLVKSVDLEIKRRELSELEAQTYGPNFWADHEKASSVMKQISDLKKLIDDFDMLNILIEEKQYDEIQPL